MINTYVSFSINCDVAARLYYVVYDSTEPLSADYLSE